MNDVPRGLLRETLRGRMTPDPADGCLDSEALAAWSEGTLDARARDAVERHAADCARCQALLAAMARTEPQSSSPSRWWRPSTFGWLAPLAAAAAAMLIWINLPPSSIDRGPGAPREAKSVILPPAAATEPAVPPPAVTVPERTVAAPAGRRRPSGGGGRALAPVPALPHVADRAIDLLGQKKDAPQAPAPVAAGKGGGAAETRDTLVVTPAGAVAGGIAPRHEPSASAMKIQPPSKSEFADRTIDNVTRRALAPADIVSPDISVRWRILPAGQVARSIDRGVTWQTQSTGAAITLTTGAAPAPTVCWLVGPGGVVVLTTDGVTWQRLAFPDASDLIAVRATDAVNATVTTADGRTFRTTDGGKSWRQP